MNFFENVQFQSYSKTPASNEVGVYLLPSESNSKFSRIAYSHTEPYDGTVFSDIRKRKILRVNIRNL